MRLRWFRNYQPCERNDQTDRWQDTASRYQMEGAWQVRMYLPVPLIRSIVWPIERAYPGLITAERLSKSGQMSLMAIGCRGWKRAWLRMISFFSRRVVVKKFQCRAETNRVLESAICTLLIKEHFPPPPLAVSSIAKILSRVENSRAHSFSFIVRAHNNKVALKLLSTFRPTNDACFVIREYFHSRYR